MSVKGFLKRASRILSDKSYIKLVWFRKFHKFPNLKNPQTFNEKLQWLKLYDRKPIYSTMVDKYDAKKYVADIIGEEHIVPTLGVWDKFDDINFDELPNEFVLKCTHDSGGLVICRDKTKLDLVAAKKKIERSLKTNYYWSGREWPYKNVKPRIIAEKFMSDENNVNSIMDYKFYCFDGEPKFLYVSTGMDDHKTARMSFITLDWDFAPFRRSDYSPFDTLPQKPTQFDEMIEHCRKLSAGHSFLRVDLYEINDTVYFSELTFSPCGGMMPLDPENWDLELGELIKLPGEDK
ncbi:MAG: glycosyl transferase [Clostridia bacterium]|nr:glycosyl transferase [Clostridia bacterium]